MKSENVKSVARGIIKFRKGFIKSLELELQIRNDHPEVDHRPEEVIRDSIKRSEEVIIKMERLLNE